MATRRKTVAGGASNGRKTGEPRGARPARAEGAGLGPSAGSPGVTMDLAAIRSAPGGLTPDQRARIVGQALVLLEQNYAHLPLKRAMHAVDPVQRLRLLRRQILATPEAQQVPEVEFHRELTDIFTSVRDLHTNYLLPAPFSAMTAFLPFMVEDYFEGGRRRYLASHFARGFDHPTFVPGVEILSWSGVPIERAVLNQARRYAGSNPEARHARGVQTLTSRALIVAAPPDEDWVLVGYRTADGAEEEIRVDWRLLPQSGLDAGLATMPEDEEAADPRSAAALGLDLEQEVIQRQRKALFAPHVLVAERKAAAKAAGRGIFGDLESSLPGIFEAGPVATPHGLFGRLRIRSFNADAGRFVPEFIRLIGALPRRGLILDVRGNGGGIIMNGERILQTLTPRPIEPEPAQFLNTALNLEICRLHGPSSSIVDLSPWVASMDQAIQTGAAHSAGFPISDRAACNAIGQKYFGPVVLITDALCYSTTDIFAAGFQDHVIGPVIGVDENTGAGGANVWTHDLLRQVRSGAGSPYEPLPNGVGMRVSIRRTLRVGRLAGAPVEDLGVVPDIRHRMTRDDLLSGNIDLINAAASVLSSLPARELDVMVESSRDGRMIVTAGTLGITRLDAYIDDRPVRSVDVQGGGATIPLTGPEGAGAVLEVRGYDGDELVARHRTIVRRPGRRAVGVVGRGSRPESDPFE